MNLIQTSSLKNRLFKYIAFGSQPRLFDACIQSSNDLSLKKHFNTNHKEIKNVYDINDCSCYSKLLEPYTYTRQLPGQQFTPQKVSRALNYWFKIPDDKLLTIDNITEKFHYASLLIDDIQDSSKMRRGSPVAHSVYGVPYTINSVILLNYLLLVDAEQLNHPDAVSVCTKTQLELYTGQGMEIYWRENIICPSEEDYRKMAVQKSGIVMIIKRLMQLFSANKHNFENLITIMCIYLQIRNDYKNLFLQELKGCYFEDLTEGKFSFPIIHAIHSNPNDHQIINILRQKTYDLELKKLCVSLLEHFGSINYTRKVLTDLDLELREEISKLGGNPLLETFLNEMLSWNAMT